MALDKHLRRHVLYSKENCLFYTFVDWGLNKMRFVIPEAYNLGLLIRSIVTAWSEDL